MAATVADQGRSPRHATPPVAAGSPSIAAGSPPVAAGSPPVAAGSPAVAAGSPPVAAARRALRLAHRGDWRRHAENTLPAFLAALEVPGCDGVELDVRAARGGVAVCYHDETLSRVHGVDRRVDELTPDELEAHGVPTLESVLTTLPRRAFLDVELKGDPGRGAFEALVAGRGPGLERAVISSFEQATLQRIAGLAPLWPRWLNAHDGGADTIAAALALGCRGISVEWHALDAATLAGARAADLEVAAWTIRRRSTFARLERLGVAAMCVEAAALDG